MASTAKLYGLFAKSMANKELNLTTDTLKMMLVGNSYTPDQDTHQYKNSVTGEVSGTGYTAGGATLANVSLAYDAASNTLNLKADNVTWPASTVTAYYAVVYDASPGTDQTRPLICYIDFGGPVSTTAGTFQITWDSNGIIGLTAS
ncbi:hypothetical protein G4X40_20090 [Rhodococcus sp. D2-41]|uniref:hypothetical protein n=1 Tax=Speluncibacter jeojiensis TaxID=2710754 RepID=UPI00240FD2AF|nr:hypothetical protein [Rhodococcus sp. D2-41]MDG3012444.1 hypothetical protein [Rhodococcus sp. D2-41]